MSTARFHIGDVFDVMATMPDASVDLVVTSPPFLALRSYLPANHPDKRKEIGSEPDPATFIDTLLALTAEWRRLLAPHGSICVELGDTYSGSGGAGGDYSEGGLREGQERFDGSASRAYGTGAAPRPPRKGRGMGNSSGRDSQHNPVNYSTNGRRDGWPMPKSMCGIPHLYHLSLAYGVNLLTGVPSPAGQWRIRNVVAWCRPNPPVGALGDKFRPATSYMTIACVSKDRYFDLDAVRGAPSLNTHARTARVGEQRRPNHTPKASMGGNNNRDTLDISNEVHPMGAPPLDYWEIPTQPYAGSHYAVFPPALITKPIQAMCPAYVCLDCGTPLGLNHERPNAMPGVRSADHKSARAQRETSDEVLFQDVRQSPHGAHAINDEGLRNRPERLSAASSPWTPDGVEGRLRDGTPTRDGRPLGTDVDSDRSGASHQRDQGRQPRRESGSSGQARARSETEASRLAHDDVPSLWRVDPGAESCPRCSGRLRLGRVLDPFAGSGTTLQVATGHGRDAIGIDIDARNADLAADRCGMFLEVVEPHP